MKFTAQYIIMAVIERQETLVRGFPRVRYEAAIEYIPPDIPTVGKNYRVLDVGGFRDNPVLEELLPGIHLLSLNISPEYHGRHGDIIYDGDSIPLETGSIPTVMAVDVLEHVPRDIRYILLQEMLRVASQKVIIGVPIETKKNRKREIDLIDTMNRYGIPPKMSILQHRSPDMGLPEITELIKMARQLQKPFQLYPATNAILDFLGLRAQVEALAKLGKYGGSPTAKFIANLVEKLLHFAPRPIWQEAYRAVLVININENGRILGEHELSYPDDEYWAYRVALEAAGYGHKINNPRVMAIDCPTSGPVIGFEGPEGAGKSTIMHIIAKYFAEKGWSVAIPTDYGPREEIRRIEKQQQKLIKEPERGRLFAEAMRRSLIAGRVHTLHGANCITLIDRTLVSLPMHHYLYCRNDKEIPQLLANRSPLSPNSTFVLCVTDETSNWQRMRAGSDDLANQQRTIDQLRYQREYYDRLIREKVGPYTGQIFRINNDGPLEQTVAEIIEIIERQYIC